MAAVNLIGSYNYALVALSVLIAMFASYAALDLAGRVTAAGGWTRAAWLLGGAGAMGTGIWSMHYIGMLAFILPIPVAYHWPTVLLSLLAAVLASVVALGVASRQKMDAFRALAGSVLMGAGISSMHYIGMAAMRLTAVCQFNSFLVVLSVVFAILISLAALWITFHFRDGKKGIGWGKLAGAVVMGAAIPVMHYTGMAAARFTPSGMPADLSHAVSVSTLGIAGIAAVTFIVLGLALLTSWVDRRLAVQTLELQEEKLQRSEAYLEEAQKLSHAGSFGWRPSTGEIFWSEETFRIFQYDRTAIPTVELVLQRTHREDAALVKQTIERASEDGKNFDFEHRLLMPDGSVKYVRVLARALNDESRGLEFVGAVMDVTAAKEAEDRIRLIINAVPALIWTARADGRLDFISPRWLDYAGINIGTIEGGELGERTVHPDDIEQLRNKWRLAVAEGNPFEAEIRVRRFDGEYRWFLSRACPLRDRSGHILGWYGNDIDIEDRKRAEEALRQSESNLAEAQKLTHTGSWAWRVQGSEALHLSEEWYRIYGFDPEQGLSAWEERLQRIDPEDRAKWQEATDRAIGEKSDYEVEVRILLPYGTVKYIRTVGHPVLNASGDVVQFVGSSMDISASKRAEETLRQSQAYLAEAQRLSHTGSWAWTPGTGDIRYWSEECYRVLGFDPDGGLPRFEAFFQQIHPDDQARTAEKLDRAKHERAEFELDYRIVHPGGEIRDIHVIGHPVLTPSGDLVEFVGTVIDVTERKRAEEERERLRQAHADLARVNRITTMGELAASVAHEVNQPIAAAVTNANTCMRWLAANPPNVEEAREAASRIVKDANRAAEIIGRIRLLFKKGTPVRELVDVNEVIQEMIVLLRSEAMRYFIAVRTELAEDLPQVVGDRVQLQQVFMNLMLNGIDAMKNMDAGAELTIKSQQAENGELLISVRDTGVGLPSQQGDQIFNAFFTTKPHGTGMGLRISRSIIESHGGRLWAADNSPRGASFCFTLPTKAETHK
jgi:PAS domain S-box-containing protein